MSSGEGYRNKVFVFVLTRKQQVSEPEEAQYPALCIMVEYLCTFPDIPDIFYGIEDGRVFLREDLHQAPQFGPRDNHKDDRHSIRKTAGAFYPRHTVTKPGQMCDKRLGIAWSDQPDDHMPERDHLLYLHAEECTKTIPGEIGKQVPVVCKIREDKTGRKEPDTRFGNADTGRQVGMPPCDIDGPDGFKTGFNNPGDKDEQGDCCSDPEDTSADSVPLPTRSIVAEILNTLRNDPATGTEADPS